VVSLSLAVINNVVLLFHLLQSISEFLKISHSSVFLAHAKSSSFLFPLTTQEFWCEVGYDGQVRWTQLLLSTRLVSFPSVLVHVSLLFIRFFLKLSFTPSASIISSTLFHPLCACLPTITHGHVFVSGHSYYVRTCTYQQLLPCFCDRIVVCQKCCMFGNTTIHVCWLFVEHDGNIKLDMWYLWTSRQGERRKQLFPLKKQRLSTRLVILLYDWCNGIMFH